MATITLQFEDTPANRAMLRQLAGHASDDNVPFYEEEATEDDLPRGTTCEEMAEAHTTFNEVVSVALDV